MDVDVRVSALSMDERQLNLVLVHDISPRKQAQAATERRARELQKLAASSLQISGVKLVDEVLQIAADRARELCGASLAVSHCWSAEDGTPTRMRTSLAEEYAAFRGFKALPDGGGIYKMLAEKQYPIRLTAQELEAHPAFRRFGAYRDRHPPLKGLLAVPLTNSQAEVVGALMVSDKGGTEFDAEDEALLVQLAQIASAGLENVRLSEALIQHMQDLEQRVSERTEELDASNKELDAFAYSVAHDLRAPLRAMHGFADAVLEDFGANLDDTGRDYLARIIKGAKNMDTLIQDLLGYSRVGRSNTPLEEVQLEAVLREVLADLSHDIDARGAEVRIDVPALTVLAHKVTLKQVFLNLVSNALKFVAPGQTPRVQVSAAARDGIVEVRIQDNGIGIAPEHRERIFNVFERLHGAETYPGTGIGLSIVKKGLMSMHGDITVESDSGGSTFRARLKEYRNG
jgi:signal transduction histidine kinase